MGVGKMEILKVPECGYVDGSGDVIVIYDRVSLRFVYRCWNMEEVE